jgi:hypothetical protein
VDDFKLINGIKRGIEKHLHAADIQTYAQLASLTPQKILSILGKGKGYSIRRIQEENWIGQARDLIPKNHQRKHVKRETIRPTIRQHYENFTIELLLDEKNLARRTHIVHIQSGDADTWAGWEAQQLFNFIIRHTGMRSASTKSGTASTHKQNLAQPVLILAEQDSLVNAETISETPVVEVSQKHHTLLPSIAGSQPNTKSLTLTEDLPVESVPKNLSSTEDSTGSIKLLEWKTTLPNKDHALHNIFQEQAFDVSLTLEIDNLSLPNVSQLDCNAKLYAKKLGCKDRQQIGEIQEAFPLEPILRFTIRGISLSKGIYRLEAQVTIQPAGLDVGPQQKLISFMESGLLQVY